MIKVIFLLLGIIIPVYVSHISIQADMKHSRILTPLYPSPIHIMNNSGRDVPVFSSISPSQEPIGNLGHGEHYSFAYAGKSGDWLYGNEIFIKDPKRIKVVMLLSESVALEYLKHTYALGIICFSVLLFKFMKIFKRKQQRAAMEKNMLEQEKVARKDVEKRLAESEYEINHLNEKIQMLSDIEAEVAVEAKINHEALVRRFIEKETQLKQQFEDDAKALEQYFIKHERVEVERMQLSYETLNNQYQSLKKDYEQIKLDGIILDINFDGVNYESLLKGRLYEIHFAKSLLTNPSFEILSWTSDKGFENGIRVKSNGDPDFLIQYDNKFIFAVECKYRSTFYERKKPNKISWADIWQAERYQKYQQENQVPVFVAIGLQGEANKPKHEYFIGLSYLVHCSEAIHWQNNKKNQAQYVVAQKDVFDNYIKKTHYYPERVLELIPHILE